MKLNFDENGSARIILRKGNGPTTFVRFRQENINGGAIATGAEITSPGIVKDRCWIPPMEIQLNEEDLKHIVVALAPYYGLGEIGQNS